MRRPIFIVFVVLVALLGAPNIPAHAINVPSLEIVNLYYPAPLSVVDIEINGVCGGPSSNSGSQLLFVGSANYYGGLVPGTTYTVTLMDGNPDISAPRCTGSVLDQVTFTYGQGEFYTVFIYPDQSNAFATSLFQDDVSPISSGRSRLLVRNAVGNQPFISLAFQQGATSRPYLVNVANGAQVVLELPTGNWDIVLRNPPPAVIPSQQLRQNLPYSDGELWTVFVAGPVNQGKLGIFDYRFFPPNN